MLAIPEEVRRCAKLFSPADDPMGTPSSKIWCPDAPSSTPLPPLSSSSCRSSFQVVSNCAVVLACPNSYSRANFRRMFRLRTNARAPACVSRLIPVFLPVQTVLFSRPFQKGAQSTLVSPCLRHKPPRTPCTHLNNRFCCPFGNNSLPEVAPPGRAPSRLAGDPRLTHCPKRLQAKGRAGTRSDDSSWRWQAKNFAYSCNGSHSVD